MKPQRLVIDGLRSYRTKTEIDFSNATLFAIVGDTGSGKSSILEAIVYALYSASTWTRQPGELISDGMRTMTVELTFEVDGRSWIVRRSMSRDGYPPPVHFLTAVDDASLRFDKAAAVDAEIERLLGLTYEAFCSAVILPQGRFERLLTETPANRTRILKGIFRLERLDEARDRAKAIAESYRSPFEDLRRARAALLEDPAATAAAARARFDVAQESVDRMVALRSVLDGLDKLTAEAQRRVEVISGEIASLDLASSAITAGEGSRLSELAAVLDADQARLAEAGRTADDAEASVRAAAADAKRAGVDEVSLLRYRGTIEQGRTRLPDLKQRRARLDEELAAIARDQEAWGRDNESLGSLAAAALTAQAAVDQARTAVVVARDSWETARSCLASARNAASKLDALETDLASETTAAKEFAARAESATERATNAAEAHAAAEAGLTAASQLSAAAAVAHGHVAGDPCPVCERKLPPSWQPPEAAGLSSAQAALAAARDEAAQADTASRDATQDLVLANQRVESIRTQRDQARGESKASVAELKAILPDWSAAQDDGTALAEVEDAARAAEATVEPLARAADDAKAAEAGVRASLIEREASLARRSGDTRRAQVEVDSDVREIGQALRGLPETLVLDEAATAEDFEGALGRLEGLEAAEAERQRALETVLAEQRRVTDARTELAERRRTELDEPLARHRDQISRLAATTERAERLAEIPASRAATSTESAITARAVFARAQLEILSRALETQITDVSAEFVANLAKQGVATRDEAEALLLAATGDRAVADEEFKRANGQITAAAGYDARITEGGALIDSLLELARLLADGQFVGFVVGARQRSLLGIASSMLDDMSGGRYGFSEDFQIVDRTSGQPRSPKTLSGGETFQASLALALGLVELAGRSGGRLSSLFLDEGFGTLDANALDEALEELERRAAAGRVIGVVSHLRSVADRLEHVLRVDKELNGTRVRWVDGADQEAATLDDLAHTAGLIS